MQEAVGLNGDDSMLVSAKSGEGVPEILEEIVARVPPPAGSPDQPLRALLFDSWYDPYRGVIILARVVDGTLRKGMQVRFWSTEGTYTVEDLGYRTPKPLACRRAENGRSGLADCQHQKRNRDEDRGYDL